MGFYPQLWSNKTLNKMKKELETKKRIFSTITDYTPFVLNKEAEGYNGPKLGVLSAVDLPASDSDINDPSKSTISFLFSQKKGVPFVVKDVEESQSNVDLLNHYTEDAKDAILDVYDQFCIKGMIAGAGSKIKKSDSVGNIIVKADILKLMETLDAKKAPQKGRYLVVSPTVKAQILDISDFISRDKILDTSAMKDGVIGTILGFEVIMSNDLPKVNASGLIDATPANNTKDALLAYQSLGWAFGRQKEFGADSLPQPLTPGTLVNIWSYFGGTIQEADFVVSMRDN
ncbi:MAG TPA: P22 phage major capsid protein family protein [Candidatus Cloacimonadota bacterium]|nr:P22 phage major capsid protein family protein [Candidatus Cloacimonadota bacterium]